MKFDHDEEIIKDRLNNIQTPEYDIVSEVHKKLKQNDFVSKKKIIRIAMVTCICLMLSVGVLAATIPSFNNIISIVSPEIADILQPIGKSSEDNGIKMEVVAAYNDDEMAVIYITMQDLIGDRIGESIDLYNYSLSKGGGFNAQVINYDKASKTATLRIQVNGGEKLNGKKLHLSVSSFLSDYQVFDEVETGIVLSDIKKTCSKTIPLNTEHVAGGSGNLFTIWKEQGIIQVLKGDQKNIKLPNIDFMHISNIGYIDDKLHIQTKWTGKGKDDHGYFYFADTEDNRLDINPSTIPFGIDESGNTKDRGEYLEYVFDLKGIDIKEVLLKGYFVSSGGYTEGDWRVKFKLQSVKPQKEARCKLDFGTWQVERIYISQLGVTLLGTGEYDDTQIPKVYVNMSDGTTEEIDFVTSFNREEKIFLKYIPNLPFDNTVVESLNINGKQFKLD
ncbi:DUF4179 domain-containing protein [Clostridiisalibacter paucivorans]|uniref:DUF4179 domain-containing protein n=1 Tax=Clostridiisalibacter paucivorans TaxID=408753 RepID=UPI00047A98B8|nr:DUF4179 domain-containing protein [Clostridiisalibacter paucivorans]